MYYSTLIALGLTLLGAAKLPARNLVPDVSNASVDGQSSSAWRTHTWSGRGRFKTVAGGRSGGDCLLIESDAGGDLSWFYRADVEPGAVYMLDGWVKTENINASTGRGALLNVHEVPGAASMALSGSNDWTRVEFIVRPGDRSEIQINCLFGGWGQAIGKAWFDDLKLVKIDLAELQPTATVHLDQRNAAINPFIYGQFIEHLGRCIYGGIWAEMLEDRKFFFPISDQYDPYRALTDSQFPVVGASPWKVLGAAGSVEMSLEGSFVGQHTPVVAAGSGIGQYDLALLRDKEYVGYVWLKAVGGQGAVEVALVWGDAPAERDTISISELGPEYTRHKLRFRAGADTDTGRLEIRVPQTPCQVGTVSLMPNDHVRGMRPDTLALLKQLNAPMYRWPGGNFVSGYDWRDGIGPRDRRPPRRNPAWTGVEHNDFGLDEFVDFCREVNAVPLIAANTGFGDAYSAAQEVEYCNASTDTVGGAMRARNGHKEPHQVKYWCAGNEMFGPWQLGFMQLRHYAEKHNRVARAMRAVDPEIELIGVGALGTINTRHDPDEKRGWSRGMLEECAGAMDYISEHFYKRRQMDDVAAHVDQIVSAIREKAEGHRKLQSEIETLGGRVMPIAMDEWNYWYRPYEYGELGCVYQLRDALGIAAGLHEYFRHSDIIQMAHYAQTVNVIGCIKTTKTDAFLGATALPLMLYRNHFGETPLDVSGNHSLLSLDVSAALTRDGRTLTLGVVNSNAQSQRIRMSIMGGRVSKEADVWRIAGDDPTAFNAPGEPRVAVEGPEKLPLDGELTVPGYSVSVYRLKLQ